MDVLCFEVLIINWFLEFVMGISSIFCGTWLDRLGPRMGDFLR